MAGRNPKFNASGCADPTAYEALKPMIKEDAALKLRTKYDQNFKCICGCDEFRITYKDKSYLFHCNQCGMYCGHRRKILIPTYSAVVVGTVVQGVQGGSM